VLVRHVLVEAAQTAIHSPGRLRAFFERVRARRGCAVAIVAVARKLAVLFWYLLASGQDYACSMPTRPPRSSARSSSRPARHPAEAAAPSTRSTERSGEKLERRSTEHAEAAYRRNLADRHRQQRKDARTPT
jgi:transposase